MRTSDLLSELTLQQVKDVARRVGFSPGSLSKSELVRGLAVSLANRRGGDGEKLGWLRAMQVMLDTLTHAELIQVLEGEWSGADGRCYETRPAIKDLPDDALRNLLFLLAMAEDEDPSLTTTQIVTSDRWRHVFARVNNDEEYEDESVDEPEDGSVHGQSVADWQSEAMLEVKPGAQLPSGLERRDERPLLPHQKRAVEHVARWLRGGTRGGVLCMPTGSGKTVTAARIVTRTAMQPGTTVLWLTHRSELADQAVETLALDAAHVERSVRIGRFQGGKLKARSPTDILVASVPTLARGDNLARLLDTQHPVRLVVVDECHHAAARTWAKLLRTLSDRHGVRLLGLSATPTRTVEDERSTLWRFFSDLIYEVPAVELIHAKVLAQPRFEFVATEAKFEATEKQRAEFDRFKDLPVSLIRTIAEAHGRNERIVAHYVRSGGPSRFGPTLVFAATITQAKAIARLLDREQIRAVAVSAEDAEDERRAAIAGFKNGSIPVLVNVNLFAEGTDLPQVSTVMIARPTTSPILFAQMVGRGLRGRAVNGTESCHIVVFHDVVLGLAAGHLATSYTEDREALLAMGFEEQPPSRAEPVDAPPLSARARSQLEAAPTREEAGLQARMHALLAALTGSGQLGLSPDAVALPLLGWWRLQAEGRCRYVPVFAPDGHALQETMEALALHVAGNGHRPAVPGLRCLPDAYVERFIDKAVRARVQPTFVALHEAPLQTQQHFARAILEGGSTWLEPTVPAWGSADNLQAWLEVSTENAASALPDPLAAGPTEPPPTVHDTRPPTMPPSLEETSAMRTASVELGAVPAPSLATADAATAASPPATATPPDRKIVKTMPMAVYRQAPDPRAELRPILESALRLPHEQRKAMLEAIHRERFAHRYPSLVDFVLDMAAAGSTNTVQESSGDT